MKKFLFINMPNTVIDSSEESQYTYERQCISNISYGILSICSYIEEYSKKEVELKVFDLNEELYKAYNNKVVNTKVHILRILNEVIENFKPDIVGISIMFNISYMYLELIVDSIKSINQNTITIVGGNLATSLYGEIVQIENVDCVSYGEGEIPFCELVDSEDIWKQIIENPSFITKEKLKARVKPINIMIEDLDVLPPINFEFVDLSFYNRPMARFFQREDKILDEESNTLVIYTTRGCPFNCCFCACHVVHGKKVRFMSVDKVISDVKLMIEKYNIKTLMINDDNFILDKDRAKKILRELIKLNLTLVFPSLLLRNIDQEIALLLSQAGVTNQLVSIESGSEYVLKNIIQKPLKKEQILGSVQNLRKAGITVDTNVIIGFPGETDEHRQETLQTIYDVGFTWCHFLIVLPVPGTSLYKQCKENNYLVNDSNFYSPNLSLCNIKTSEYEPEHIQEQVYMMNLHANFVYNYNLRIGNFDECILHFNAILKSVPDHAFAYYGLMKAYEGKGDNDQAMFNKIKFEDIIKDNLFWNNYAKYFNLI